MDWRRTKKFEKFFSGPWSGPGSRPAENFSVPDDFREGKNRKISKVLSTKKDDYGWIEWIF